MRLQAKKENRPKWKCSLKLLLGVLLVFLMLVYVSTLYAMIYNQKNDASELESEIENVVEVSQEIDKRTKPVEVVKEESTQKTIDSLNKHETEKQENDKKEEPKENDKKEEPKENDKKEEPKENEAQSPNENLKLRAYIEKIDQSEWDIKPLPVRQTKAKDLEILKFDEVRSCSKLQAQFPTDEHNAPTNKDPFLPWIHDVFPTSDGKYIQFVAQNKRRCQTGHSKTAIKKFMQPNVALFQHVPIKRIHEDGKETRYRLTSHEEADKDAVETRFICRFKPSMEETLSVFNFNYDFHTLRKSYKATFTEEGFDNHMIWSSQFLFRCPVPPSLQEEVKSGRSVINDYASLYVDIIPIRTPPRYGPPTRFLPPRLFDKNNDFDVEKEWGQSNIVPLIEDSGRWENIPICKPTLMTYPDEAKAQLNPDDPEIMKEHDEKMLAIANSGKKKHDLIACTWTSAAFKTRGGRTTVNDGMQRLRQWLEFNQLVGIDHVYIFDNSGAASETENLKPITDLFPGYVTRVDWPAKVCNNNKGNVDNKGDRSSQYAADASCRLRFGSHSKWLASFDTDEYLVPLEKYKDLKGLLRDVENEPKNIKVLNFQSKRSKPRLRFLNTTYPGQSICPTSSINCFDPSLSANQTFLEVYNCNSEKAPRKNLNPAEKAIYQPDYVLQFFVHYATVTTLSATGQAEANAKGEKWFRRYNTRNHARFVNETTEATMLHTKAVVAKETTKWQSSLKSFATRSNLIGVEYPHSNSTSSDGIATRVEMNGESYNPNCYPVERIDDYWSPKLHEAIKLRNAKA